MKHNITHCYDCDAYIPNICIHFISICQVQNYPVRVVGIPASVAVQLVHKVKKGLKVRVGIWHVLECVLGYWFVRGLKKQSLHQTRHWAVLPSRKAPPNPIPSGARRTSSSRCYGSDSAWWWYVFETALVGVQWSWAHVCALWKQTLPVRDTWYSRSYAVAHWLSSLGQRKNWTKVIEKRTGGYHAGYCFWLR